MGDFWSTVGDIAKAGNPLIGVFDAARVASQAEDPNDGPDGVMDNAKQFGSAFFKHSGQGLTAKAGLAAFRSAPVQKALEPIAWTGNQASHGFSTVAAVGGMLADNGETNVDALWSHDLWSADTWSKAWDASENVSGGEAIVFDQLGQFGGQDRTAPGRRWWDEKDGEQFDKTRQKTGFKVAAGATDIVTTWYADPTIVLGKAAKAARVGNAIIDAEHADQVAKAIPAVGERGLAQKAAGTFASTPEETASRLYAQVAKTDNMSITDAAAHFKPMLERSGDAAPIVGLLGQAGRIGDVAAQRAVKADTLLAAAGSKIARDRLIQSAPDIARALQRSSLPPEDFQIVDGLIAEGLTGKALIKATKQWSTKANKAELKAYAKDLDNIHTRIEKTIEVGLNGGVENVGGSLLGAVKQKYRAGMAHEFFYSPGPSARTVRVVHWATGQRMKGVIDVSDAVRGHDELMDGMTRSGLFTGAERQRMAEKWWSAPTKDARASIAHAYPTFVLAKFAEKHGLSKAGMRDILQQYGDWSNAARTYTTQQLEDARINGLTRVTLEDPIGGVPVSVKTALLETHVANNVAVPDINMLERIVRSRKSTETVGDRLYNVAAPAVHTLEDLSDVWRTLTLARPGFIARTQFDTQARAMVVLGATTVVANAMRGLGHWGKNTLTGAEAQQVLDEADGLVKTITGKHIATEERAVSVGKGAKIKARPVNSDRERLMLTPALHTGDVKIADAILQTGGVGDKYTAADIIQRLTGRIQSKMVENADSWVTVMPDSDKWAKAWLRSKDALVASEAGREVLRTFDQPTVDMLAHLRRSPAVRNAWKEQRVGNPDFDQWLDRLVAQTEWTAPTPAVREALLSGKVLDESDVAKLFKSSDDEVSDLAERMPAHAPEMEYLNPFTARNNLMGVVRNFVRWMADQPDTVLGRVPFYSERFFTHVEELGRRELARSGEIGAEARASIERVARHRALMDARQTMYDTARFTGAHDRVARMGFAFLGAWEDSMRAWGRMFYDDPSRIGKLTKTWYAPDRAGFIVDENGNRVKPGDDSREKWIVLPMSIPGTQVKEFRLRKDSFNSMFQGEVPWAPGFSPMVQVPVTQIAARTFPEIADPNYTVNGIKVGDNPLLRQMFGFGLPKTGVTAQDNALSVLGQATPGWIKRAVDIVNGDSQQFADAYAMGLNAALIKARQDGRDPNTKAVQEWADEQARRTARSATIMEFVSNFGLGLSGEGSTKAEFYRERYREISANADALKARGSSVNEEFLRQHPEAAGLKWSFTQNDTGINATLAAENRSRKYGKDISKNPEFGWFYVGSDNIGGEFSAAVYSSQFNREGEAGSGKAWRSRQNPAEIRKATNASLGWDSWNAVSEKVNLVLQKRGLTSLNQKGAEDLKKIKADFKAALGAENPDWAEEYGPSKYPVKLQTFIDQVARPALKDGRLKNRSDIKLMGDYLELRDKAMQIANANGYSLGSSKAANLRQILNDAGAQMAADNLGFSQMWTRLLSREVGE